jgi:hypothetical protein
MDSFHSRETDVAHDAVGLLAVVEPFCPRWGEKVPSDRFIEGSGGWRALSEGEMGRMRLLCGQDARYRAKMGSNEGFA